MSADGSLLSRVSRLFAARAGIYCAPALIAGVLGTACLTALSLWSFSRMPLESTDPLTLWRSLTAGEKFISIFGLLFASWTPILLAARGVSRITLDQISGRPLSFAGVLVDMVKFVPAALVYALIVGLGSMIGSSMCLVPGLAVASLFALVVPAGAQEAAGIFAAMRLGLALAPKVFGRVFLVTIGCLILMVIVAALRHIGLDQFLPVPRLLGVRIAIMHVPGALLVVLANIAFTLLYLEAKGKEAQVSLQSNTAANC